MRATHLAGLIFVVLGLVGSRGAAQEPDQEKARPTIKAPPGHAVLSEDLRGWYFVPRAIKERYETAVSKLEGLRRAVLEGTLSPDQAKTQLEALKGQLESLKKEMEGKKVLVSAGKPLEQTEVVDFPLGPNQRVAITANQVSIKGWNGKGIRCELKKTVLPNGDEPIEPHLKAIQIRHKLARAEFAGKTQQEWEAADKAFREGEGAKATPAQRAERDSFLRGIRDFQEIFRDFAGEEVDQISVEGLEYRANPWISREVQSDGGEKRSGGLRQRYASLTVYLPACKFVCVRGARMGLLVEDLKAHLVIEGQGGTDIDHMAKNGVRRLEGNLESKNFPLHFVENVSGDTRIGIGQDFGLGGSGLTHTGSTRELYPPSPLELTIKAVQGSTRVRVGRCDLELVDLRGPVEIHNDFGNLKWTNQVALARGRNLVYLGNGRMEVVFGPDTWKSQPIFAATQFGRIKTNLPQSEWEDFSQTVPASRGGLTHNWMGFQPVKAAKNPRESMVLMGTILQGIVEGNESAWGELQGVVLINRSGPTQINRSQNELTQP